MKKTLFIVILFFVLLIGYWNTPFFIRHHIWKNFGAVSVSDMIYFRCDEDDAVYELVYPALYHNGEYVGRVIFCTGHTIYLYIEKAKDRGGEGGFGEYVNKGKRI